MTEFEIQAQQARERTLPHKTITLDRLHQIDGRLFDLDGMDVTLTPGAMDRLNTEIGISRSQLNVVRQASGDGADANFRNYMAMAQSITRQKEIVVVADPTTRTIVNLFVPRKQFIPLDQFFDFVSIFMENAGYTFERMVSSDSGTLDNIVYMQNEHPIIDSFAPDEDTVTNGAFIRWSGDAIELGNYFTRLVCTNGMTQTVERQRGVMHTFNPQEARRLIEMANDNQLAYNGFEHFRQKALQAIDTYCSLRELRTISNRLTGPGAKITQQIAEAIVPLREYDEHFTQRGIDTKRYGSIIKTDITVWQLYNILTDFASHASTLHAGDALRHTVNTIAATFLNSTHDIKQYIEYV